MFKKFLNKKTACIAITATLFAGISITCIAPTASTICRELNMAGISISLDKYASEKESSIKTASVASSSAVTTSSAISTEAPAETPKPTAKPKKKKKKKKVSSVYKDKAIAICHDYVNIRKHPATWCGKAGRLEKGCAAKVLSYHKKGKWVKIESGNVRGYIKKSYLAIGKKAEKLEDRYGIKYAMVKTGETTVNVREKTSTKAKILTQIPEEEMYDIVKGYTHWVKIEIDGDTKGYVSRDYIKVVVRFKHAISQHEIRLKRAKHKRSIRAEKLRKAALRRSSSRSSSRRSSSRSSSSGGNGSGASASGSSGSAIARYALNFVGNPYVWGGTSLTHGCDCSGFVMSIYAQYGHSLPHSSASQSGCGRAVSLSAVQPGDLIFYRHGGSIGHVAMYIGGGRIVHAASRRTGIITSNMNYNQPACARRIV